MAIWGCVFHSSHPVSVCVSDRSSGKQLWQPMATVPPWKLSSLWHVTGLMTGSQSTQTSSGTLRLCNYPQNCRVTVWVSGWFTQNEFDFWMQNTLCLFAKYFIQYSTVSGKWKLCKSAHWVYKQLINHVLYKQLLQTTSWCRCLSDATTINILKELCFYAA